MVTKLAATVSVKMIDSQPVGLPNPGIPVQCDLPSSNAYCHNIGLVMPALVAGIHVLWAKTKTKTWMAGTSPAMTMQYIMVNTNWSHSTRANTLSRLPKNFCHPYLAP
jgi:hypothetical protein